MTSPAPLDGPMPHPSRAEYRQYLESLHLSAVQVRIRLKMYDKFTGMFCDINMWTAQSLATQFSFLDTRTREDPRLLVRPYLYYLVYRGLLRLEWPFILRVPTHVLPDEILPAHVLVLLEDVTQKATQLGYSASSRMNFKMLLKRLYLFFGPEGLKDFTEQHLVEYEKALRANWNVGEHPHLYPNVETMRRALRSQKAVLFQLRVVLYHQGKVAQLPKNTWKKSTVLRESNPFTLLLEEYLLAVQARHVNPTTLGRKRSHVTLFIDWMTVHHPEVSSFEGVNRKMALEYANSTDFKTSKKTGQPVSLETRIGRLCDLMVFFRDTLDWELPGAVKRPLLNHRDLPKRGRLVPRYIPAGPLGLIMEQVEKLTCPYQKAALTLARWSGARRNEICRLEFDCLDEYPDGSPRLRLPVGKNGKERVVPLHPAGAAAVRALQALQPATFRAVWDERSGQATRRLFLRHGQAMVAPYLFDEPMRLICKTLGLGEVGQLDEKVRSNPKFSHQDGIL